MRLHTSAFLGLLVCLPVRAELTPKPHVGPGGIEFQSRLETSSGTNDNVTFQSDPEQAHDLFYVEVAPYLEAVATHGADKYTLRYNMDYRRYKDSLADDYINQFMEFESAWRFGKKMGLTWHISQALNQELRGQGVTEGFSYDQFKEFGLTKYGIRNNYIDTGLLYSYGALDGRGRLDIGFTTKELTFRDTHHIEDASEEFYQYLLGQEFQENSLAVDLYDQASRDSRFRYSFITNKRNYHDNKLKNSTEHYFLLGLDTALTGKTALDGKIALLQKQFTNNPEAETFRGINWDLAAHWTPVKQATFSLFSWQKLEDPDEAGGYILNSHIGAAWKHRWWGERLTSRVEYGFEMDDHRTPYTDRHDQNHLAKVSLGYDIRPSIRVELNYLWNKLNSSKETEGFYIGSEDTAQWVERQLGYDQSEIQLQLKLQI
ncbi:capsular biosynthesis protein [Vibrio sinaloensis]|uniref:capsular biosynthesis protein n=1 Tax=Photobacterium sp. (strain ATCC 43367) TaxID=379097 RepID=UPI0035E6931A